MKEKQTVSSLSNRLNTKTKKIAAVLSCLCVSLFSIIGTTALAQTEQSSPAINREATQNKEQNEEKQKPNTKAKVKAPEKKNSQKKDNKAATDTFKPSEEISEDLPVSFPVDI